MATFTPKELVYPVVLTTNPTVLYTATGVTALVRTIHFQRRVSEIGPDSPFGAEVSREVMTDSSTLARAALLRGTSKVKTVSVVIPDGGTIEGVRDDGHVFAPVPSVAVYGYEIS